MMGANDLYPPGCVSEEVAAQWEREFAKKRAEEQQAWAQLREGQDPEPISLSAADMLALIGAAIRDHRDHGKGDDCRINGKTWRERHPNYAQWLESNGLTAHDALDVSDRIDHQAKRFFLKEQAKPLRKANTPSEATKLLADQLTESQRDVLRQIYTLGPRSARECGSRNAATKLATLGLVTPGKQRRNSKGYQLTAAGREVGRYLFPQETPFGVSDATPR